MTKEELKKRLKKIKATPIKTKSITAVASRRDLNYVAPDEEEELSKVNDFFDFEDENLQSAREQMAKADVKKQPEIEISQKTDNNDDDDSFFEFLVDDSLTDDYVEIIQLDDMLPPPPKIILDSDPVDTQQADKPSEISFESCQYIKADGGACQRKINILGEQYCKTHKNLLNRKNSSN